jgi:cytochrome P450
MEPESDFVSQSASFTPPYSVRVKDWPNPLSLMFGKHRRDSAYGFPEQAFEQPYKRRKFLYGHIHMVSDPDVIAHVLLHNQQNFVKPDFLRLVLKPIIGQGLFTAEQEQWKIQRKIVAPTFTPGALTALNSRIAAAAKRQIVAWPSASTCLDMAAQANSVSLEVISDALFSSDERLLSSAARSQLSAMLNTVGKSPIAVMLGLPEFSLRPSFWQGRSGIKHLRASLGDMIDERIESGKYDDFFGGLIRSLYEKFPAPEARRLAIDNALTFYVAGHETTAVSLSWTIFLLAAQPAVQNAARSEAAAALTGDIDTLAERLPLLRQIIEESMRLYPPVHRIERQALADDQVNDILIRKGDLVSIWPMLLHRHQTLWARPDTFDHTRFSPSAKSSLHRFQYIPFGAGPRICVGARMAVTETLIVLAHWLVARRFALANGQVVRPIAGVTLCPAGGMPLLVSPIRA